MGATPRGRLPTQEPQAEGEVLALRYRVQGQADGAGQRVLAFVNRIDEVTALLEHGGADAEGLGARIRAEAALTGWHDSNDYGVALGEFTERYAGAVGPRTTVLVLGDARTNMSDPNPAAVRQIARRAVHWLNPEPCPQWGTGDSAAYAYAELVAMRECRNARQLGALIGRLLPV